jgi:uncharacterized protein YkwD
MLRRMLVLGGAAFALALSAATATAATTRNETASLLRAINAARAAHGLPLVHVGTRLQLAARAHTEAMLTSQTFSHGPFAARLRTFHVTAPAIAENLALATGSDATAQAFVRAWLASPPHRRNLLGPAFTLVGIAELAGSFQGFAGVHLVTVDFAGA